MEGYLTMNTPDTSVASSEKIWKRFNWKKIDIPKKFRVYLLAFAAIFVICCLCGIFQMTNSKTVTITLNSASVSKGQNPDGSAFDIYEILSDEVLETASEKLKGRISVTELKRHLTVSDALGAKTNQQMKQSILDGEYDNTYFPTVYNVTYSTISEKIRDEGFLKQIAALFKSIFSPSAKRVLGAVAESYQESYAASYLTYNTMFEINWADIDAMDYYIRAEALRTEATRILRFLQDKTNKTPTTESSSQQLTYGDLNNDLGQLISVDIENHQAYIIQNSITSSRTELLRQFRYMEELHKEEMERQKEAYLVLDEAVDVYDSSTTKVVFIPSLDQNDSFYMNRTKVGLDYLVERADAARLAADEAEHNAKHYQYLQTCFAETVTPQQSQLDHTDAIYLSIKEALQEMTESVKALLAESNQTENEGIKVSNARRSVGIINVGMSFAKRFVFLSMGAYVLICILSAIPKKKTEETPEV